MEDIDVRVLILNSDESRVILVLEKGGTKNLPGGKAFKKPSRWGLPGGRSEPGDKNEIFAAVREVAEETGFWIYVNYRPRVEMLAGQHRKILFSGYAVSGEIKVNPEEILDCRWFSRKILYDNNFDMYSSHRQMAQRLLTRLGK